MKSDVISAAQNNATLTHKVSELELAVAHLSERNAYMEERSAHMEEFIKKNLPGFEPMRPFENTHKRARLNDLPPSNSGNQGGMLNIEEQKLFHL